MRNWLRTRLSPVLLAALLPALLALACGAPSPPPTDAPRATPAAAALATPAVAPRTTPAANPTLRAVAPQTAPAQAPESERAAGVASGVGGDAPATPAVGSPTAPAPQGPAPAVNDTGLPLTLPAGFRISLFTPPDVGPLRFMAFSPDGILFVTIPSPGGLYSRGAGGSVLALPDLDGDGVADEVRTVIGGLDDLPHGLAFHDGHLYVAQENGVSRYVYQGDGAVGPGEAVVEGLPAGGGHVSRTVGFSPSGRMYVSIGSSCNVCDERDQRRAAIVEYNPDGSEGRIYARGLRNAVGFVFHQVTGEMWATENGRDHLGDDLPPDEINIVRDGQDYGWPDCYGDRVPDPGRGDPERCAGTAANVHDIQAHSAPLGLRFIDSPQFPPDWQGDLLVAYHGSWNRSVPTGYKVVRLDVEGDQIVGEEDFIHGWLLESGTAVGRPVDVVFDPEDGALYISDDRAGVIYRVTRAP